jgi:TatD DNase family protein
VIAEQLRYVDCHLHLQDARLLPRIEDVLRRAGRAGVRYFLCNGSCEKDWPAVLDLAITHSRIIPCFGYHPWYAHECSADWPAKLEEFLTAIPSAVGEIGLDRWIEPRNEAIQEEVFLRQFELARKLNRPAMIHCLRAWEWFMDLLKSHTPLPAGMLIHAYGGPAELIPALLEKNAWFSFAGTVLHEKNTRARAAIRRVPLDRLLLETDAPDLPPPPSLGDPDLKNEQGKIINEPVNLPIILREVAKILGRPETLLAETLWKNSLRFLAPFSPLAPSDVTEPS